MGGLERVAALKHEVFSGMRTVYGVWNAGKEGKLRGKGLLKLVVSSYL